MFFMETSNTWSTAVSKLTWVWKSSDGYVNTWNDDVIDLCVDGDGVDGGSRETDNAHSDKHINRLKITKLDYYWGLWLSGVVVASCPQTKLIYVGPG